jgi:ribonuclease P protein component
VFEKNTFYKNFRLLKNSQFQNVFSQEQLLKGEYFVIYYHPNSLSHSRLGVIASRKKCRFAVWRNRLKRQVREAFRHNQSKLLNYDIVAIARQGAAEACKNELRQCLDGLFLKLIVSSPK